MPSILVVYGEVWFQPVVVPAVVCLRLISPLVSPRVPLVLLVELMLKWHPLPMTSAGMLSTLHPPVNLPVPATRFPTVKEPKAVRNPLPLTFRAVRNLVTLLGAINPPRRPRTVLNMVVRIPRLIFTSRRARNTRLRVLYGLLNRVGTCMKPMLEGSPLIYGPTIGLKVQ